MWALRACAARANQWATERSRCVRVVSPSSWKERSCTARHSGVKNKHTTGKLGTWCQLALERGSRTPAQNSPSTKSVELWCWGRSSEVHWVPIPAIPQMSVDRRRRREQLSERRALSSLSERALGRSYSAAFFNHSVVPREVYFFFSMLLPSAGICSSLTRTERGPSTGFLSLERVDLLYQEMRLNPDPFDLETAQNSHASPPIHIQISSVFGSPPSNLLTFRVPPSHTFRAHGHRGLPRGYLRLRRPLHNRRGQHGLRPADAVPPAGPRPLQGGAVG